MSPFETVQLVKAYRAHCEDCVHVIDTDDRTIVVVADGAGGVGNGCVAADTVIREISSAFERVETAEQWRDVLHDLDFRINIGESTAVVVDLHPDRILGASVGDSAAWIFDHGEIVDLTVNQTRKPLLGSQDARPISFTHRSLSGVLIVGSDGFFDYVKRDEVAAAISRTDFADIPQSCLEMVRLPSGDLWDDVSIVACRVRRPSRARKRYEL